MRRATAILLIILLATADARADSWSPWRAHRVADPTGRFYVVLTKIGWAEGFATLVAAAPGSPPVPAEGPPEIREGDRILARVWLPEAPYRVLVSSTGAGFAVIDAYGRLGGWEGRPTRFVDRNGETRFEVGMVDLFPPERLLLFPRSISSTWWYRGAWLDDAAGLLVLVPVDGEPRAVSTEDGRILDVPDAAIARALDHPDPAARALALEVAILRRLDLRAKAAAIRADPEESRAVHIRAAGLLTQLGVPGHEDAFLAGAFLDDDEWITAHLPDVLGRRALPLLVKALRSGARGARLGLLRFGRDAIPAMEDLLRDGVPGAAEALLDLGARESLPVLLRAVASPDERLATAALRAAACLGGADVRPELEALLAAGTEVDDGIRYELEHLDR